MNRALLGRRQVLRLAAASAVTSVGGWYALAPPREGKLTVFLGDSILKSKLLAYTFSKLRGEPVVNCAMGGTRLSATFNSSESAPYAPLSIASVSACIASRDFRPLSNAAQALYEFNNDDNRSTIEKLARLDWPRVGRVIVLAGTNDFGGNAPLGRSSDDTPATVRGALNAVSANLRQIPETIFLSPLWRARFLANDGKAAHLHPNGAGIFLREYVAAILEQAARNGNAAFDLYRYSGIGIENAASALPDGLHPSRVHSARLGARIAGLIGATS